MSDSEKPTISEYLGDGGSELTSVTRQSREPTSDNNFINVEKHDRELFESEYNASQKGDEDMCSELSLSESGSEKQQKGCGCNCDCDNCVHSDNYKYNVDCKCVYSNCKCDCGDYDENRDRRTKNYNRRWWLKAGGIGLGVVIAVSTLFAIIKNRRH